MKALIGKKVGMTRVYNQDGTSTSVTVLDVSDNYVARYIKNGSESTHLEIGKDTEKKPDKAELGNYAKSGRVPKKAYRIKLSESNYGSEINEGDSLSADLFEVGTTVHAAGVTKGKGFTGVMKRWGFKGGKRTHGQSDRLRAPGSIGSRTIPGRVFKGKKMAGRSGRDNKTIQNLKIVDVLKDDNLILVSGSVPGFNGSYVVIYND